MTGVFPKLKIRLRSLLHPSIFKAIILLYALLLAVTFSETVFNQRQSSPKTKVEENFVETGSGQDPLQQAAVVVNVQITNDELDLTLKTVTKNSFIELYCSQPYEVKDHKFLVLDIVVNNRANSKYSLDLKKFSVLDTNDQNHQLDLKGQAQINDALAEEGELLSFLAKDNLDINAGSQIEGKILFSLPISSTPKTFIFSDIPDTGIPIP